MQDRIAPQFAVLLLLIVGVVAILFWLADDPLNREAWPVFDETAADIQHLEAWNDVNETRADVSTIAIPATQAPVSTTFSTIAIPATQAPVSTKWARLMYGRRVASRINARFAHGKPSNNIDSAGIVVRMFDAGSYMPPWIRNSSPHPHRVAGSIINARVPLPWLKGVGAGLVISPDAATETLLCSFWKDSSTFRMDVCEMGPATTCIPGCIGSWSNNKANNTWCSNDPSCINKSSVVQLTKCINGNLVGSCAWKPIETVAMLNVQEAVLKQCLQVRRMQSCVGFHNEVVLDSFKLRSSLPAAIEAIFVVDGPGRWPAFRAGAFRIARASQKLLLDVHKAYRPVLKVRSFFGTKTPFRI